MKKIIFSLAVVLGMASCNSWDDEHSQNYGDGPAVTIDLITTTDSTFTFTVNPAQGTNYYSYLVTEGSEPREVDPSLVLKTLVDGTFHSDINKYADKQSVTENMRNAKTNAPLCSPNTSYVIYAVAANDKGVIGKVATQVVTTTDGEAPVVADIKSADDAVSVNFSEPVQFNSELISAKYYLEWDESFTAKPIPTEDLTILAMDNIVNFKVNNVPAGAYVFISWAEGAFVDSKGNKCPAMNSDLNMNTGAMEGVYMHLANVSWDINPENFGPESGSLISDYTTWQGTITFENNVYRNDYAVEAGDIFVTYTNSKKSSKIALEPTDWEVKGNVVTFRLPEAAGAGDIITVGVKAGVLFDVCGNGNNEFVSTTKNVWWKFFAPTKDMVLGNFGFTYVSYFADEPQWEDGGNLTIAENPEKENGIIVSNFYQDGSQLEGYVDIAAGKMYLDSGQIIGTYTNSKGTTYGLALFSINDGDYVTFDINADGTLTSEDTGVLAFDETFAEALGWWDVFAPAVFTKQAAAGAAKRAMTIKKSKTSKRLTLSAKALSLRRTVRK